MRPANVTRVVKDRNNRARSVAAGVVSGAGPVVRCFKSRTLMRVPRVGSRRSSSGSESGTSPGQGSPGGGCAFSGGAGRNSTHQRGDGKIGHNDVAGRWSHSTCPLPKGQSTPSAVSLGTGWAVSMASCQFGEGSMSG